MFPYSFILTGWYSSISFLERDRICDLDLVFDFVKVQIILGENGVEQHQLPGFQDIFWSHKILRLIQSQVFKELLHIIWLRRVWILRWTP